MDLWAVCLYQIGGDEDGESSIEFVRASDRDDAIGQALNLNELGEHISYDVMAAAKAPEDA